MPVWKEWKYCQRCII